MLNGAQELNLTLTPSQLEYFFLYLRELQKWNRRINLTGRDDDMTVLQHHFLDSLSCLKTGLISPGVRVLDVGTGAGFPGLPLKIYCPQLQVTLVDAVLKKIAFVRHLCRMLNMRNVECLALRLGKTALVNEETFEVIVSRAVGAIPYLLELATPCITPTGKVMLQRGAQARDELESQAAVVKELGYHHIQTTTIEFSFLKYPRYILTFTRVTPKERA